MPTSERSYVRDFTLPDDFGWCRRVEPVSMAAHASYHRGNAVCGMMRVDSRGVALDDLEDLRAAELVISFTEDPTGNAEGRGRGGRHVEFGMAHALGKRLIVVGFYENVFHDLPGVEFFPDWERCMSKLTEEDRDAHG